MPSKSTHRKRAMARPEKSEAELGRLAELFTKVTQERNQAKAPQCPTIDDPGPAPTKALP